MLKGGKCCDKKKRKDQTTGSIASGKWEWEEQKPGVPFIHV